jgi:hypothetical protein
MGYRFFFLKKKGFFDEKQRVGGSRKIYIDVQAAEDGI